MLRSRSRSRSGGSGVDSDALAWAAKVTADGGTYSAADLNAMSTAIASLRAEGLWSKMTLFGPLYGGDLTAALVQYRSGSWVTATNVNFVAGDYTRATGLTGNGSTKYLRTGLVASTGLTTNSTHLALYNRSSSTGAAGRQLQIGSQVAGGLGDRINLYAPFNDSTAYSDQYNLSTPGGRVDGAITAPFGFVIGTRTAANVHTIYRNGAQVATNATTGGALPAFELYVFAINNGGAPTEHGEHVCGMYSAGSGLSNAEQSAYNTIVEALMDAAGRGVQ